MADANEFPTPKQGDDGTKIVETSNAGEASTSIGKVVIEIADDEYNDWAQSINEKFDGLERRTPKISRVPQQHRRGDNEAYEPRSISIGPYHRGNPRLQLMEYEKLACMRQLVKRCSLVHCLREIEAMETRARSCYSENINLQSKEFVEMMLMDGCFIVFYLLKPSQLHCPSWVHDEIRNDLILFENQLPFFVVEHIYSLVKSEDDPLLTDHAHTFFGQVSPINSTELCSVKRTDTVHHHLVYHLLHLYSWFLFSTREGHHESSTSGIMTACSRCINSFLSLTCVKYSLGLATSCQNSCSRCINSFLSLTCVKYSLGLATSCQNSFLSLTCVKYSLGLPIWLLLWLIEWLSDRLSDFRRWLSSKSTTNSSYLKKSKCTIGSATFLEEAGIEIRKKKQVTDSIMDAEFRNGVMEITPLFIDVFTVSQFRNLIALEKSDHYFEPQVIAFARFMDYIISTSKDVALLRKKGIIQHAFGSDEEVAAIFNQLTSGTLEYQTPKLTKMYEDVDEYCRSKRHQWRAILMRDYFGSPWAAISLVAAVILISLTFLQTYFSMYSYFRPP